jgi:hypothetical protein
MVVLCRMLIDLEHEPGIQLIVVSEVRRNAYSSSLPE